ncbi:MAG: type VI secretion system protein TssA [Gammaproteobacteria bacterium]|nr:type VI secretion system protein TssA [Gammaproteobacteria bacterium]
MENTLDFEKLLHPISEEKPTGVDLREDPELNALYYEIKDARNTARSNEAAKQQEGLSSFITGDWKPVVKLAKAILSKHSKDIEIACYLTEALARTQGFSGLGQGFQLLHELLTTYWDDLYPHEDEDGLETKLGALISLNGEDGPGTLITPINCIDLTQGKEPAPFASWHYQQAQDVAKTTDKEKREILVKEGASTLDMIQIAVRETKKEFFTDLIEQITYSQEQFTHLCAFLEETCSEQNAPPSANIRKAIANSNKVLTFLTKDLFVEKNKAIPHDIPTDEVSTEEEADDVVSAENTDNNANETQHQNLPTKNREQAIRKLMEVADFFGKTEPHSPIAHLVKQAVRWADMELGALMRELIPNEDAYNAYCKFTGLGSGGNINTNNMELNAMNTHNSNNDESSYDHFDDNNDDPNYDNDESEDEDEDFSGFDSEFDND